MVAFDVRLWCCASSALLVPSTNLPVINDELPKSAAPVEGENSVVPVRSVVPAVMFCRRA